MAKEKSDAPVDTISEDVTSSQAIENQVSVTEEVQLMPLRNFADTHAEKYGIELMAGFYHEQEADKHIADTEDNWHMLLKNFSEREVK